MFLSFRKSDIEGVKTFKQVRLSNYIEYIDENDENWYCDWNFTALNQKDLDHVYSSPYYFTKDTLRVDDETGQDFKWFFLGSQQTGTPLHQDFNHTHAWNGVIFGQKEWIFCHPDDTPYLYEGNINVFDEKDMEQKPLVQKAKPIRFTQKAGEIIYAPRNWWHQVVNTEHTLAVSENFWFAKERLVDQR
ncbi:cupin-like domain-containing protein [Bacillus sp. YC2]|uniref:cupin-like domain-containing protein n=1 Tax=Bacillus sp. YC2 TaxID=2861287 RepID=UPI001CA74D1A|nr:cupin-like domain-containing protein [Bacillus sp. YC2]MBY8912012.1 cupin-like domain-containing protein [Bacillus sp. YC2]